MKRCPKCNRTYPTDKQKFCTHDGGVLEAVDMGPDTIRIDSSQLDDDAPTKVISRELVPETTAEFDPFKTVISRPEATAAEGSPTTRDLPSTTLPPTAVPPQPPPPGSGQAPPVPPQTFTPAPPPPAAAPPPQPTQRLVGSAPIAASAPLPALAQTPPPTAPLPVKKKSKLPLVLGILVVLLVLGIGVLGAAYWFVVRPRLAERKVFVVPSPTPAEEPTPNIETTPDDTGKTKKDVAPEAPPYSPPADAVEFVNSIKNLDGKLAEHYVDFSFYYPNRWNTDPTAGVPGASNFAKVERRLPPTFTQENFAVGWYSSAGSSEADRTVFPALAEKLGAQFKQNFPDYRKVSEGPTKAGIYDGYELRFEAMSRNTTKGDLKLWGRMIFLPPVDGGKNGVTLLMLATSLAPELKSVDDVGSKGELPMMLASFRFGKK